MTGLSSLDNALQDFQNFHTYRHDIFISYSTRQEPAALSVARAIEARGLDVFFAPEDLRKFMLDGDTGQYTRPLQDALIRSCHCLALVSQSYLESSWCLREMWGSFNLQENEPRRTLTIYPLEKVSAQIPGRLRGMLYHGTQAKLIEALERIARTSTLQRGQTLKSPPKIEPFAPLPLREFYEPPGLAPSPPWKKDHRSPHGHPAGPPYALYEDLVREYMIQIQRGHLPGILKVEIEGLAIDAAYLAEKARADALRLIQLGYSPFRGVRNPTLGMVLADVQRAEEQGIDDADIHYRKGFVHLYRGDYVNAARELAQAIEEHPKKPMNWVANLAQAHWGMTDPGGGLAVIERYQPDLLAPLLRIQAVCLQAVGRAAEAQKVAARAMQKEPAYSLAEERVNTYYENDDELERWLAALAAAGFS